MPSSSTVDKKILLTITALLVILIIYYLGKYIGSTIANICFWLTH